MDNTLTDGGKVIIACDVCGKIFCNTASLKMHSVRSHRGKMQTVKKVTAVGETSKQCITTSEDIAQEPDKRKVTIGVTGEQAVEKYVSVAGKKGSKCVTCNRCFPNARRLASHVQETHTLHVSGDDIAIVNNTGKHVSKVSSKQKCNDCGHTFVNMANHKKCGARLSCTPHARVEVSNHKYLYN